MRDLFLSLVTCVTTLPIIPTTEGIIKTIGKSLPDHPRYGHIFKKFNKLNFYMDYNNTNYDYDDDYDDVIIAQ